MNFISPPFFDIDKYLWIEFSEIPSDLFEFNFDMKSLGVRCSFLIWLRQEHSMENAESICDNRIKSFRIKTQNDMKNRKFVEFEFERTYLW